MTDNHNYELDDILKEFSSAPGAESRALCSDVQNFTEG